MFKKERDLEQRSQTLLKNKEARKLRGDVLSAFSAAPVEISEEGLAALLPTKGQVTMTKLAQRSVLYSVDGVPLFFDHLGRHDIYPTCMALWRLPLLRTFVIHSPVSEYVLRGADLMLPGLVSGQDFSGLQKGDKVAVCVSGNPCPFAVGICETSETDISTGGMRGKAVSIMHTFGDELWRLGGSFAPNEGFGVSCIYAIDGAGVDVESEAEGGEGEADPLAVPSLHVTEQEAERSGMETVVKERVGDESIDEMAEKMKTSSLSSSFGQSLICTTLS